MDTLQRFFPGDVCYARYEEDGLWYEARVLESDGGRGATVVFSDYGNTQKCSGEQLKSKLKEEKKTPEKETAADLMAKDVDQLDFDMGLDGVLDAVAAIDVTDVAKLEEDGDAIDRATASAIEEAEDH